MSDFLEVVTMVFGIIVWFIIVMVGIAFIFPNSNKASIENNQVCYTEKSWMSFNFKDHCYKLGDQIK